MTWCWIGVQTKDFGWLSIKIRSSEKNLKFLIFPNSIKVMSVVCLDGPTLSLLSELVATVTERYNLSTLCDNKQKRFCWVWLPTAGSLITSCFTASNLVTLCRCKMSDLSKNSLFFLINCFLTVYPSKCFTTAWSSCLFMILLDWYSSLSCYLAHN